MIQINPPQKALSTVWPAEARQWIAMCREPGEPQTEAQHKKEQSLKEAFVRLAAQASEGRLISRAEIEAAVSELILLKNPAAIISPRQHMDVLHEARNIVYGFSWGNDHYVPQGIFD